MTTYSSKNQYALFKLSKLRKTQKSIWVIGDSRSDQITPSVLSNKEMKEEFINLSMGGANIDEVFSMFWTSISISKPNEVYLGINWDIFSTVNNGINRVREAEEMYSSSIKYVFGKPILKSVLYYLQDNLFLLEKNIEQPPLDKDSFWNYQINVSSRNMLQNHRADKTLYDRLDSIIKYCDLNHIKLIVFTPPTHIDLQRNISYYNQLEQYKEFKKFLKDRVMFFDLDIENDFTVNKKNFRDPFHLEKESVNSVFKDIF